MPPFHGEITALLHGRGQHNFKLTAMAYSATTPVSRPSQIQNAANPRTIHAPDSPISAERPSLGIRA
jgi:hypothetical protein